MWQLSPVLTAFSGLLNTLSLHCEYNLTVRQLSLIRHQVGIHIAKELKAHKNTLTLQEPEAPLAAGGRMDGGGGTVPKVTMHL